MQIGMFGLKNSGKSTLFDMLTGHHEVSVHERIGECRHGVMNIPDERLDFLQKTSNARKQVHPTVDMLDLPPLQVIKQSTSSDSQKIFEEIKNCNALIQVVRQFTNPSVPFEQGGFDPFGEKNVLDAELVLMDLSIVENRLERIVKMKHKVKDFYQQGEPELLERCHETLENEESLNVLTLDADSEKMLRGFQFLTIKPRITIINIDESEIEHQKSWIDRFEIKFSSQKGTFGAICGLIERELLDIPEEERNEFRKELGIEYPAKTVITELLMKSIHLIRFLTATEQAAQSWIIPAGTTTLKAAGIIHTDIERGFIRAEVVSYDDYVRFGSITQCKEHGCFRLEGKNYMVQEGDVVHFRFNV